MTHAESFSAMSKKVRGDWTGKSDTDDAFDARGGWLACVYRGRAVSSAPELPSDN